MTSSTRIRFGALAAAAAVVAGGFFAAAPANAATGTITVANTSFTEGDWGGGISTTGSGFTPDSVVTISLNNGGTAIATKDVTASSDGSFTDSDWIPSVPLPLPAAGSAVTVSATSDQGDDSNEVTLTVDPAIIPAPAGLQASVSTITTADLGNKDVGFDIVGGGYTPGETVTVSAVYNGKPVGGTITLTAGPDGSISAERIHIAGALEAGSIVVTAVGETSGVSHSTTVTVTGETIVSGGNEGLGGSAAPAPAAAAKATRLPVVSG
jgi:hypothetical protein